MATVWQQCPLWTQQIGGLTGILGRAPAHLTLRGQPLADTRCSSFAMYPARPGECMDGEGSSSEGRGQVQELLWRQFFLDPSLWWDNRRDKKKNSGLPDFRCKGSGEVLWVNNLYKPAWVDAQLAALDIQMARGAPTSKWSMPDEPGRAAGLEMAVPVSTICQQGNLTEAVEALERLVGDGPSSDRRRQEQELLWRQFFLDPTLWWDNRRDKKNSRAPDFRRKGSSEVIWLDNLYKPAWVDEQLAAWDMQMGRGAPTSESSMPDKPGPGRPAGLEMGLTAVSVSSICPQGKLTEAVEALECLAGGDPSTDGRRQEQELLWRQFFLDPTMWWDNRRDKKSSRSPDFRRKGSRDVVWLNNLNKPAWVDEQLAALDMQMGRGAPTSKSSLLDKPDPGWPAGSAFLQWQGDVRIHTVSKLCEKGQLTEAVEALTILVQTESVVVSISLLYSVVKRCVAEKNLVVGRQVHDLAVKLGYESDAFLGNHILRMYACGGRLQEAMDVFTRVGKPNAFMWFSIISAHCKHGKPNEAIQLYHEMRSSGVKANCHVFAAALQACAIAADLESGRQVHTDVLQSGIPPDSFVCNCLVDMYAKCGELEDARRVFDSLATKDLVTWTALIAGYAQHGLGHEALVLYGQMEQEGLVLANHVTFACLLKACASAGALQLGRQLHSQILERGQLEGDILVGTCLVDMYAKCGELKDARRVFDSLATKNVVTWNALIAGCGSCDEGHNAVAYFDEMLLAGIKPDGATFACLLVACSHEGLVNEGRKHFNAMVEKHGVKPTIQHYNCMIDLLGRAGDLDEAENMLLSCESQSNVVGLTSLLNSCKSHGDIERATRCFESLVRLDPQQAGAYVLLAHAYADAGRWADVERIETLRRLAGANKKPAMAGIEVKKQVHTFIVGESRDDISCKVESTNVRLKEEGGYIPHTKLVLKPLSEKEKEDELCGHAEKLALAFGLLNTPSGTPLLVTKNLRMCKDCHSSTEIMSRIEKRDIVVRDAYRLHRFAAGSCSCNGRP